MKLRQALEKAQNQREGGAAAASAKIQTSPRPIVKVAGSDWKPPVYSESDRAELDEAALLARRCVCIRTEAPELEYYKVLRTRLQHLMRLRGWRTLMITSAEEGAGKTLTAVNLALTFAKAFNQTVMLVDADLRRPGVHRLLGFEARAGLVDHLVEERPLKDFILWPGIAQMTVIPAGRPVANSAELLGSARMKAAVEELRERYDDRAILFDTGPVLSGADALALAAHVDGYILVVAEQRSARTAVKKALALLPREKFLGFVLNRQEHPLSKGYY